jgi:hypothetical protein
MVVSFLLACYFQFAMPEGMLEGWQQLLCGVGNTTIAWLLTAFFAPATDQKTLRAFCRLVNPGGPGWRHVYADAENEGSPIASEHPSVNIPMGILCMLLGCSMVYSALFATGFWMYGNTLPAIVLTVVAAVSGAGLIKFWTSTNGTD